MAFLLYKKGNMATINGVSFDFVRVTEHEIPYYRSQGYVHSLSELNKTEEPLAEVHLDEDELILSEMSFDELKLYAKAKNISVARKSHKKLLADIVEAQ